MHSLQVMFSIHRFAACRRFSQGWAFRGSRVRHWVFLLGMVMGVGSGWAATVPGRDALVRVVLEEDGARQIQQVAGLAESSDPVVVQVLTAWRQGGVYVHEAGSERVPFLLDAQQDSAGKVRGIRVLDGEPVRDPSGKDLLFVVSELTAVDTSSKLRRAIKTALDLQMLAEAAPGRRRDAAVKLGQEQNADYLPYFRKRLAVEREAEVRRALEEAVALTELADPSTRAAAAVTLGGMRSINGLGFLQQLEKELKKTAGHDEVLERTVHVAVVRIEDYVKRGQLVGTAFRGLSLSAVLLVAALGLAITFGLMGIINMAHGEVMMAGAYTAYVVQNLFRNMAGTGSWALDLYFPVALVIAFVVAALLGLILERGVIRFLYKRPLESMLATWGVSLVLQQVFRHVFGAANVQVSSPRWLSGSLVLQDVLFAYNRMFVIGFALFVVALTWAILSRTTLGLQIRAVMQNRGMAACLGVRTARVNMMTFAFGSGLAGMAGACLSQIGNVGPGLGQTYILDCFMIVVLGGVGNLVGTVSASLGVGVTDQILQPWLGAVMGKITVLAGIILFLQWRPAGLFVTRSRSLDG